MTTTEISLDASVSTTSPSSLQYIPATIEHNAAEPIHAYFTQFIHENEDKKCLETTLQGRPLEGEVIKMPEGHECVVVQMGRTAKEEDDVKVARVVKRTEGFTCWNYDRVPSDQDQLRQAMQWMKMATLMHCEEEEENKKE